MTAIETIKAAQTADLTREHKKRLNLRLGKPLTLEEIDSVQEQIGLTLPVELRSLLAFCSTIDGCLAGIDFTGATMTFGQDEIFPNGLPIAADGLGNSWVLDITPQTTNVAPIFFACHDAPIILYQSADIASFLADLFALYRTPPELRFNKIQEDRIFEVWRKNPGVIDQPSACASSDATLQAFASGLPDHFQLVDLRSVEAGMGFSWGRYGPQTEVRRHGYERIFAYGKAPKTGFLSKLFGR